MRWRRTSMYPWLRLLRTSPQVTQTQSSNQILIGLHESNGWISTKTKSNKLAVIEVWRITGKCQNYHFNKVHNIEYSILWKESPKAIVLARIPKPISWNQRAGSTRKKNQTSEQTIFAKQFLWFFLGDSKASRACTWAHWWRPRNTSRHFSTLLQTSFVVCRLRGMARQWGKSWPSHRIS